MKSYISLLPLTFQSFFGANITESPSAIMANFPANPIWKPAVVSSLASQPVTFFQLATVSAPLVPSCRTLTLSGFFGETPYAEKTEIAAADQNPIAASDILYVASNAGSKKFTDLSVSSAVEAAFFFPALWSQIRIRGHSFPISPRAQGGESEAVVRKLVESHMELPDGWDWEKEILKIWERQDEKIMKSKFPPTTAEKPVPDGFRLLIIVPEEVQQLLPGNSKLLTWSATVNNGAAEWVRTEGAVVKKAKL